MSLPSPEANEAQSPADVSRILAGVLPAALAILVFGTIFGGMVAPRLGAGLTVASSALIFSGSVQFAVAGLMISGASPAALLLTAAMLNLRNPLLAAVIRPRLASRPLHRAVLAWFLIDETVGLTMASRGRAEQTLFIAGIVCYVAWVGGTALGAAGGALVNLKGLAAAVFPVLFVGLAALSATRRHLAVRAVAAAILTVSIAVVWPGGRGLAPVIAALAASLPGRES